MENETRSAAGEAKQRFCKLCVYECIYKKEKLYMIKVAFCSSFWKCEGERRFLLLDLFLFRFLLC